MAIIINTNNPQPIIDRMKSMMDASVIDTWSYDEDGDFTHIGQWKNHAWMSPIILDDKIIFKILGRKNVQMSLMEYSIFHGRFVEMLLNHFPKELDSIHVTAPLVFPNECKDIII